MKYAVNCSIMFTELPLLKRSAAARAAGFEGVEFWWPFETSVPDDDEVAAFVNAVRQAGVQLVGLNFFGGNGAGDRGLVALPEQRDQFRANVPVVARIGRDLNCPAFNAAYGNWRTDLLPQQQDKGSRRTVPPNSPTVCAA